MRKPRLRDFINVQTETCPYDFRICFLKYILWRSHDPSFHIMFFPIWNQVLLCVHAGLKFMVLSLPLPLKGQNCVYHCAQIPIQILNKMKKVRHSGTYLYMCSWSEHKWNIFLILELKRDTEAIGWLQVQGHPGLHSKFQARQGYRMGLQREG